MSLISREDAIKELMSWLPKLENGLIHWTGVKAMLENLPTVNPDGWISVEKKLPEDGQVIIACYPTLKSGCMMLEYDKTHNYGFVAWMPLPPAFEPKEDK